MQVVGGKKRRANLLRQLDEVLCDAPLKLKTVVHELDEVVLLTAHVLVFASGLDGFVPLPEANASLNLTGRAARRGDQTIGILRENLAVHAGPLAHLTIERSKAREPEQIVHAHGRAAQECEVGVGTARRNVIAGILLYLRSPLHARSIVTARAGRHVRLNTDDGLHTRGHSVLVKLVGPKHVSVVGDRDCVLAGFSGSVHELADLRGPIEHRVIGVDVKVNEIL